MRPAWHARWRIAAFGFDVLAVALGLAGAAAARFGWAALHQSTNLSLRPHHFGSAPWILAMPFWLGAFAFLRLYNPLRMRNGIEEARRIVTANLAAPIVFVVAAGLAHNPPSETWLGVASAFTVVTVGGGRRILRGAIRRRRQMGEWRTRAVVIGGREAKRVIESLSLTPEWGFEPVASSGFKFPGVVEIERHDLAAFIRASAIGAVVIVASDLEHDELRRVIAMTDTLPVEIFLLPGLEGMLGNTLQIVPVGLDSAIALEPPALRGYQRVLKRTFDITLSGLILAPAAPFMGAIAIAIRANSRGPILFRQRRPGYRGRDFTVFKFRTMKLGENEFGPDAGGYYDKQRPDPRVTGVGRLLRRFSLDELPQLWNVLKGDMSLVGPRPVLPGEGGEVDSQARRMNVRPGMTGLWQVNGRSDLSPAERTRLDITYVQNWSLLVDFYVLARTIPAVLLGRGAY